MTMTVAIPLRSKRQRRALAVQKLNHLIPAAGLLVAGQQAIAEGHGFGFYLGVFELVSSAALIVLTAREIRSALRWRAGAAHDAAHADHGVDWVDIAAGFMLVAEALEHWHVKHRIARPVVLSAVTTFALGLFHGRIAEWGARRRMLRIDDDGIAIPGRPFKRRLAGRWSDVQAIEVGERWAVITTRGGRVRRLDLRDLVDEAAVRGALLEARGRVPGESHTAE